MDCESFAFSRSEDDRFRSNFVRDLVRNVVDLRHADAGTHPSIPRRIVQFWDDPLDLPADVRTCMDTWQSLRSVGFSVECFDDSSAKHFIARNMEARHLQAFDACYHPAMRSDYFRMCYIGSLGGCYVDADDVYSGDSLVTLFEDGCLKLNPLCYDVLSGSMVPPDVFSRAEAETPHWIFYFNNNPIISPPGHPVVLRALERSTKLLNAISFGDLPEVQSTTGPGNLTASLVAQSLICNETDSRLPLTVLPNWEQFANSVWPLSYRTDARNWRLSNRKGFLR